MTSLLIESLTIVLLLGALGALIYFIIVLEHANHVFKKWQTVSDTLADATVKLVPAVINATNIAGAIHKILEIIAQKKEKNLKTKKNEK